jgi:diacylglycerol kinase
MKLRWSSFRCAIAGIAHLFKTQPHARWHALCSLLVVIAGIAFKVERSEWLALISAMAPVWVAEAFNTALELTCDAITREQNPLIGHAKDAAAGGVLIAALFAVLIAAIVFAAHI